jgi:hypothetical protein
MVAVNLMTHHISRISGLSLQARERERERGKRECVFKGLSLPQERMDGCRLKV